MADRQRRLNAGMRGAPPEVRERLVQLIDDIAVDHALYEPLQAWKQCLSIPSMEDIPESLLHSIPDYSDDRLMKARLPLSSKPEVTAYLPRKARQEKSSTFHPTCITDLLQPEAVKRIDTWVANAMEDMARYRQASSEGKIVNRKHNQVLALGASDFQPLARGTVWDLRRITEGIIVELDFEEPLCSHLNLEFFREQLSEYPDQELVSMLIEGASYKADLEEQVVLLPHQISFQNGMTLIQVEMEKLTKMGFYSVFTQMPFLPIRLTPRGSVPRASDPARPRPTSNGSAPHKEVLDTDGKVVVPINVAATGEKGKWPKEPKPTVSYVLACLVVFMYAAEYLNTSAFMLSDDCTNFFNQLFLRPEERWQEVTLMQDPITKKPMWVAENVVSFGISPASNIAQRWADALMAIVLREFALRDSEWMESHKCSRTAEYVARRKELNVKGDTMQHALAVAPMYTDDSLPIIVGPDRVLRFIFVWHHVFSTARVMMSPKKQLGVRVLWIGVSFVSCLGIAFISLAKRMKASNQIRYVLTGKATLEEYRSLLGLLEHFVGALRLRRSYMAGLWQPFSDGHLRQFGPQGLVKITEPIRSVLGQWLSTLASTCGTHAMYRGPPVSTVTYDTEVITLQGDAAGAEHGYPALGGFCAGYWWIYNLDPKTAEFMHITEFELLAAGVNIMVFCSLVKGILVANPKARVLLLSDALAAVTSTLDIAKSQALQLTMRDIEELEAYKTLKHQLLVTHVYGEANVAADAASRGFVEVLEALCKQMGVKCVKLPVPQVAIDFVQAAVSRAQLRFLTAVEQQRQPGVNAATMYTSAGWYVKSPIRKFHPVSTSQSVPLSLKMSELRTNTRTTLTISSKGHGAGGVKGAASAATEIQHIDTLLPEGQRQAEHHKQRELSVGVIMSKQSIDAVRTALTKDESTFAINLNVESWFAELSDMLTSGIPTNTLSSENTAWDHWQRAMKQLSTPPWRSDVQAHLGVDSVGFQREIMVQALGLLIMYSQMRVGSKPQSAMVYLANVRRMHKRCFIPMGNHTHMIRQVLNGMMTRFTEMYGVEALIPSRKEPFTNQQVKSLVSVADGTLTTLGIVDRKNLTWFSLFLIFHVAAQVGIRKDEAASPFSDVLPKRRPTRAWLKWYYQGQFYPYLDAVQLANLGEQDAAVLMLPPSKADQHGLKWSASPYFLPFRRDATICAARMFRDLELLFPVTIAQRSQFPLFARSNGLPFTGTQLDEAIQAVMAVTMTPEQRKCHSFHSFRIYLCACLYRANASTERIQRMLRWKAPESIGVYAREDLQVTAQWLDSAADQDICTIQVANLPVDSMELGFQHWYACKDAVAPDELTQ